MGTELVDNMRKQSEKFGTKVWLEFEPQSTCHHQLSL